MAREVSVASFLAGRGAAAVVPPTDVYGETATA